MHRSKSFLILLDLAFVLKQECDDLFVPVFSCEVQSSVSISIISISIDLILN